MRLGGTDLIADADGAGDRLDELGGGEPADGAAGGARRREGSLFKRGISRGRRLNKSGAASSNDGDGLSHSNHYDAPGVDVARPLTPALSPDGGEGENPGPSLV